MIALMTRSFAEAWGLNIPPDAAYLIKRHNASLSWEPVTWAEVLEKRRQKQARILAFNRECPTLRAVRVSVRYFDQFPYGGWHTYIDGAGGLSEWTRDGGERLMELFPMPQLSLFGNTWQEWMKWFARTYPRGTFDGRPRGVAYCWALCDGEAKDAQVKELIRVIQPRGKNDRSRR
ncbi:MAG: hypothetical protein ACREA2_14465 [Blastocatellia bacterium]